MNKSNKDYLLEKLDEVLEEVREDVIGTLLEAVSDNTRDINNVSKSDALKFLHLMIAESGLIFSHSVVEESI